MQEKQNSQTFFIILSILYIVTGAVIIAWPNMSMELLGKAIGIGMLVLGLTYITIYFTKDHLQNIMQMDLTKGVVFASFGAFILMHADFAEMAIPFGVGILLLIGGMTKIQYAIEMHRILVKRWKTMILFAVILMAGGLVLLYNPFRKEALIYVIAGSLILDGVLNVFSVLFLSIRVRKLNRGFVPDENGRLRLPKDGDARAEGEVTDDIADTAASQCEAQGDGAEDDSVEVTVVSDDGQIVPYK